MSTKITRRQSIYGYPNPQAGLQQEPLVMQRDPLTSDAAEVGTIWVNTESHSYWILTSSEGGTNVWTTASGGSETLTALTVNPGNITVTAGDINVSAGDITAASGTITAGLLSSGSALFSANVGVTGNVTVGGDLTVTGNAVFNGDLDITSSDAISFTSTSNTAGAISLLVNGGTSETLVLESAQGTGADSIELNSVAGGISITANAAAKDVTVDSVLGSINIVAGEAAADAIVLNASNAAGGVIINAGTGGVSIAPDADTTPVGIANVAPSANRTVTVAGGTVITAVTDTLNLGTGGVSTSASAAKVINIGTGNTLLGSNTINIGTGTAASGTHAVNIATGTGGGTKVVNIGNADGLTTNIIRGPLSVNTNINQNISMLGGTSTGTFTLGNSAAGDINIITNGTIILDSAGNIVASAATGTAASPTNSVTLNKFLMTVTFTGFTTAAAASQVFTITDSFITTNSAIFVTAANLGTNDAQMTLTRVQPKAGSVDITLKNNGSAALNGDVILSIWVYAP